MRDKRRRRQLIKQLVECHNTEGLLYGRFYEKGKCCPMVKLATIVSDESPKTMRHPESTLIYDVLERELNLNAHDVNFFMRVWDDSETHEPSDLERQLRALFEASDVRAANEKRRQ